MHLLRVKINSDDYPTSRCYPFNIPVLRNTSELIFNKPIAFFVGENGSGKSTLLDAITRKCGIYISLRDPSGRLYHRDLGKRECAGFPFQGRDVSGLCRLS